MEERDTAHEVSLDQHRLAAECVVQQQKVSNAMLEHAHVPVHLVNGPHGVCVPSAASGAGALVLDMHHARDQWLQKASLEHARQRTLERSSNATFSLAQETKTR